MHNIHIGINNESGNMKKTTRECPLCGNKQLVELISQNTKICVNHKPYVEISWVLDEGQKPLLDGFVNLEVHYE